MKMPRISPAQGLLAVARYTLIALIFVPILLLLGNSVKQYLPEVLSSAIQADMGVRLSVVLVGIQAALIWMLHRRAEALPVRPFLAAATVVAVVTYAFYSWMVEVKWVSDFEHMWKVAELRIQQRDFAVRGIYDERVLPVLVPFMEVFGAKRALIPALNSAFLVVSLWLGYDILRRSVNHKAAQIFTVLWLGTAEPVMALEITSHDIWGLFFLSWVIWSLAVGLQWLKRENVASSKRYGVGLGFVVIAAMVAVILNIQREISPVVLIALVLVCVFAAIRYFRAEAKTWLLLTGVFIVSFFAFSSLATSMQMKLASGQAKALDEVRIGGYSSSLSNGSYAQGQVFVTSFFEKVPEPERSALVDSIPLSDFALQPKARVRNLMQRAEPLSRLGSQTYFYHADIQSKVAAFPSFVQDYNAVYSVFFAILGLMGAFVVLVRGNPSIPLLMTCFTGVLVGVTILILESQPRYVFPVWWTVPIFVAAWLGRPLIADAPKEAWLRHGAGVFAGIIIGLVAFIGMTALAERLYSESNGRVISGWSPTPGSSAGLTTSRSNWFEYQQKFSATRIREAASDPRGVGFGKLALVLAAPGITETSREFAAAKSVCVDASANDLAFLFQRIHATPLIPMSLSASVAGKQVWSSTVANDDAVHFVQIEDAFPSPGCHNLELKLSVQAPLLDEAQRAASQVDVFFPRVTE